MSRTIDLHTLVYVKARQTYVLLYDERREQGSALQAIGRWAEHAGLNFTWADAAVMGQAIRREVR